MPANIAHMIIAHKAADTLRAKGVPAYTEFADMVENELENCRPYYNLGSMGPDLFYYRNLLKAGGDMLLDGYMQAAAPEPWAYQMHSLTPNGLPLSLAEVVFRDVARSAGGADPGVIDRQLLAFAAGYLTHVAADQIVHPYVNRIAGAYYRSGDNRRKHRECEVFQDYFLYSEVYRLEEKSGTDYDFLSQDFHLWADCIRALKPRNTEDWFRFALQRAFVETYGHFPTEDEIEDSVDNILLTLRSCTTIGPYRKARDEYSSKETSSLFAEYVTGIDYIRRYREAVELAVVYLAALQEVYSRLIAGADMTVRHRTRFLSIVQGADLSCPLEGELLRKATVALANPRSMDAFLNRTVKDAVAGIVPTLLSVSAIRDEATDLSELV